MDPRRLVLFAAVVEHGSVSRAAAALHITQPSLSRQIARLELEAGISLLHRLPAGVTPTAAGHRVLRRADAVRGQIEVARRELAELRQLASGELRLAAFPTAAATLAIDALVLLRARHPALRVTVEERDGRAARAQLLTGRADIALTFADADAPASQDLVETSVLLEEPMLLALPAKHPLARSANPRLADVAKEPWIVGTEQSGPGLISRACLRAGFEPHIVARLDSQPAIQEAVAAGVGVTLIPSLGTRGHRAGIVLRSVRDPSPSRRVSVEVAAGPHQPAVAAGLDVLRAAAERERERQGRTSAA